MVRASIRRIVHDALSKLKLSASVTNDVAVEIDEGIVDFEQGVSAGQSLVSQGVNDKSAHIVAGYNCETSLLLQWIKSGECKAAIESGEDLSRRIYSVMYGDDPDDPDDAGESIEYWGKGETRAYMLPFLEGCMLEYETRRLKRLVELEQHIKDANRGIERVEQQLEQLKESRLSMHHLTGI